MMIENRILIEEVI